MKFNEQYKIDNQIIAPSDELLASISEMLHEEINNTKKRTVFTMIKSAKLSQLATVAASFVLILAAAIITPAIMRSGKDVVTDGSAADITGNQAETRAVTIFLDDAVSGDTEGTELSDDANDYDNDDVSVDSLDAMEGASADAGNGGYEKSGGVDTTDKLEAAYYEGDDDDDAYYDDVDDDIAVEDDDDMDYTDNEVVYEYDSYLLWPSSSLWENAELSSKLDRPAAETTTETEAAQDDVEEDVLDDEEDYDYDYDDVEDDVGDDEVEYCDDDDDDNDYDGSVSSYGELLWDTNYTTFNQLAEYAFSGFHNVSSIYIPALNGGDYYDMDMFGNNKDVNDMLYSFLAKQLNTPITYTKDNYSRGVDATEIAFVFRCNNTTIQLIINQDDTMVITTYLNTGYYTLYLASGDYNRLYNYYIKYA